MRWPAPTLLSPCPHLARDPMHGLIADANCPCRRPNALGQHLDDLCSLGRGDPGPTQPLALVRRALHSSPRAVADLLSLELGGNHREHEVAHHLVIRREHRLGTGVEANPVGREPLEVQHG